MTQLASSPTDHIENRSERQRSPWTVKVLAGVVFLLALVTSYGAIYFTFYFENPEPGAGSWVFVTAFLAINVLAATAMVGLLRGRALGWRLLVAYGVLGVLWSIAKIVFWSETEALVFGAANLIALGLLAAPRTRAFAATDR